MRNCIVHCCSVVYHLEKGRRRNAMLLDNLILEGPLVSSKLDLARMPGGSGVTYFNMAVFRDRW